MNDYININGKNMETKLWFPLFNFLIKIDSEIKTHIDLEYIRAHHKNIDVSVRSLMLCLFAYMETIFFFKIIYDEDRDLSYEELRRFSEWKMTDLIKKYLLSKKNNKYYALNYDEFNKIKQTDLMDLRHYLTHFYSTTDNFWLYIWRYSQKELDDVRKENPDFSMLSPYNLYYLINCAANNLILEWDSECKKDEISFNRKMKRVLKIAKNYAAVEI